MEAEGSSFSDSWPSIWLWALHNRHAALLCQISIFLGSTCENAVAWSRWLKYDLFQKTTKAKHVRIKIQSLRDNFGNIFTSHVHIENTFLNFYKNLWTSASFFSRDQIFFLYLSWMIFPHWTLKIETIWSNQSLRERSFAFSVPCYVENRHDMMVSMLIFSFFVGMLLGTLFLRLSLTFFFYLLQASNLLWLNFCCPYP